MLTDIERGWIDNHAHRLWTPGLLLLLGRLQTNVDRMGEYLGGFARLRPHIKTHKCPQIVRRLRAAGIERFKCATVPELEMLLSTGCRDVVLAYPLIGPVCGWYAKVVAAHPEVKLATLVDSPQGLADLNAAGTAHNTVLDVYLDLDVGLHRTGVAPGAKAAALLDQVRACSHLRAVGVHIYDGHLRATDPTLPDKVRRNTEPAIALKESITRHGEVNGRIISSGSRAFRAAHPLAEIDEVSPGTWVLWDTNYNTEMPGWFEWACLITGRVVSRYPTSVTLDAGCKAISRDAGDPSCLHLVPERLEPVAWTEEHQVCHWLGEGPAPSPGTLCVMVPRHVCTTVYLHDCFQLIDERGNLCDETWPILTRTHQPTQSVVAGTGDGLS